MAGLLPRYKVQALGIVSISRMIASTSSLKEIILMAGSNPAREENETRF
jgi:hypothetical protein